MTLTGNRSNSFRRLLVPIVLLALIIGTTLGEVWHRHADASAETCPLCHMSHQAVEPAVSSVRTEILMPEGSAPEVQEVASISRLVVPRLPARAPPA